MSIQFEKKPTETDAERISRATSQFLSDVRSSQADKAREIRNWRAYSGVDFGQWSLDAVRQLIDEQRPIHTFNYLQQILDNVAGQLLQNPYETTFIPGSRELEGKTNLAQGLYDYCRQLNNWDAEDALFVVSGLVYQGVMETYIEYADHPHGDVAIRAVDPRVVWTDRRWRDGKIRNLRYVYFAPWVTAEDIAELYGTKSQDVRDALSRLRMGNKNFCEDDASVRYAAEEFYNSATQEYRLVNVVYMVTEELTTAVSRDGKKKVDDPSLARWALEAHPNEYMAVVRRKRTCKVLTFAPGLSSDLILADGPHPLQLGHVPFQFWSAKNLWGESQGVIDSLFDAQEVLNKDEATTTELIGKNNNGAMIGDATLIPEQDERDRLVKDGNKAGTIIWAESQGNKSIKDAVVPMHQANLPDGLRDRMERTRNFLQAYLPNPMQGQGQGANESGTKFAATLSQSLVKFEPMNQSLQRTWNERGAAFIPAAKTVYSGSRRRMFNPKSKATMQINRHLLGPEMAEPDSVIGADEESGLPVENPVEMLDRYDVIVAQSPRGATMRDEMSRMAIQTLQITQNPVLRSRTEAILIDNLIGVPEEQKAAMKADAELWAAFQQLQIKAQAKQLEQTLNPPQPPPGMPGVPGQPMVGPKEAAKAPGMGPIPDAAGVASKSTSANNAPTDMGARPI